MRQSLGSQRAGHDGVTELNCMVAHRARRGLALPASQVAPWSVLSLFAVLRLDCLFPPPDSFQFILTSGLCADCFFC